MEQISCYCSQRNLSNCDPVTGKIKCRPGIKHCLLVLKQSDDHVTEHIQDCWNWDELDQCPLVPNICYSFSAKNKGFVSCCCQGDSCNYPNTSIVQAPNMKNKHFDLDSGLPSTLPVLTSQESPQIPPDSPVLLYIIFLPALLLLILLSITIFFVFRHLRRRSVGDKQTEGGAIICSGNASLCLPPFKFCFNCGRRRKTQLYHGSSDHHHYHNGQICPAFYCPNGAGNGGYPCILCGQGDARKSSDTAFSMPVFKSPIHGGGWLAEGEIENLFSVCTKIRISSRGRFGEVWLGEMKVTKDGEEEKAIETVTKREVAIKVFHAAEKRSWETETEVYRLPRLSHPNILHFIGVDKVSIPDNSEAGQTYSDGNCPSVEYWLVTDYLTLGSVHDYITAEELSWGQMLRIVIGMARGLSYLHTEVPRSMFFFGKPSIAHRDFKSRNVLLKSDLTACISDMGLAILLESGQGIGDAHLQVGTGRYMAPEVLDGAIQFNRSAFLRIDVYALGLVIWELMTRCFAANEPQPGSTSRLPPYKAPFEAELGHAPTMEQLQHFVAQHKKRPTFPDRCSHDMGFMHLWETVQECWDQDAEARLTAGCIAERIQNLELQFPPSPNDPSLKLPSLEGDIETPLLSSAAPDSLPLLSFNHLQKQQEAMQQEQPKNTFVPSNDLEHVRSLLPIHTNPDA